VIVVMPKDPFTGLDVKCIDCGSTNIILIDREKFTGGRSARVYHCLACNVRFGVIRSIDQQTAITERLPPMQPPISKPLTDRYSRLSHVDDTAKQIQEQEINPV
jgi:hypothetical protein